MLSLIWIPFGVGVPPRFIWIFALKGFLLATSWYMTLKVVKTADLSIVIVTNILSAVLSFVLGIVILGEHAGIWQIVGSAVIILGVAGINLVGKKNEGRVTPLNFILLTICALITTASHIIDKYTTTYLNPQQTQFNFLFFVMLFSWVYFGVDCIKDRQFNIKRQDLKNYWIYLIGVFLFVADFFLFMAYKVPGSQMITISIISKLKVVVAVLAGVFIFKEKNMWKKLSLSAIVILGAVLVSIF